MAKLETIHEGLPNDTYFRLLTAYQQDDDETIKELKVNLLEPANKVLLLSLNRDLAFLHQWEYQGSAGEGICPSGVLLEAYFYHIDPLDEATKSRIAEHVGECSACKEALEELEEFDKTTYQVGETAITKALAEHLGSADARPALEKSLLSALRKVAHAYLKESLIDPLFQRLEKLSAAERRANAQRGLVPGLAAVRGGKTRETVKFEKTLKSLLLEEEALNSLIEKGDKEAIRKKLNSLLDDAQMVDEILDHLS